MSAPTTPRASRCSASTSTPPRHQRRGDCDWRQLKQEVLAEMEAEAVRALMLAKVGLERHLLDTHVETILGFARFSFDEPQEHEEHEENMIGYAPFNFEQHEQHEQPPLPVWDLDLDLAWLPFFAEPMNQDNNAW